MFLNVRGRRCTVKSLRSGAGEKVVVKEFYKRDMVVCNQNFQNTILFNPTDYFGRL